MHNCPKCNNSFKSERGMKVHHAKKHNESLAGELSECDWCGDKFRHNSASSGRFCSYSCYHNWLSENPPEQAQKERIGVKCANCGAQLERVPARIERSNNHFCNKGCMGEWRSENVVGKRHPNYKEPVELECEACGNPFEVWPSQEDYRSHCSKECMAESYDGDYSGEYKREYFGKCEYCGDRIERIPSYPNTERVFCDKECYDNWQFEFGPRGVEHPNWNGGKVKYGPTWTKKLKDEVRKRDDKECQACGLTQEKHKEKHDQKLEVHHIIPAREFSNHERRNSKGNLVSLCRRCHKRWEGIPLQPQ